MQSTWGTMCFMKIHTLIISAIALIISSTSNAVHPRDFVSDGALAILSIRDGDAINSLTKEVSQQANFKSKESLLANYLSLFIINPNSIDFSEEIIFVIEPTVAADGQRPTGMFGAMPHLVFICKPKEGKTLDINKTYLTGSVLYDDWFIASGGKTVIEPETFSKSPILKFLKKNQVSMAIKFGELWKQIGPIVQMTGGMMVGSMNKPGSDGIISPETKKAATDARKAFGELMKLCGDVEVISMDVLIKDFKLATSVNISLKTPEDISINNKSMLQMASLLADDMFQYGMSSELTRKLLDYDIASMQGIPLDESFLYADGFPVIITKGMKLLSDLSGDNVVSYNLTSQNGLSIAALTEVESQKEYLAAIPNLMNEFTGVLLNDMNMSITPSVGTKNSWDISMIGSGPNDQKILNAIFPKNDTLRFRKYAKDKISIALGPSNWKSLSVKRATPLAKTIKKSKDIDIDFALSFDARDFACGFADVSKVAGQAEGITPLKTTPSAMVSFVFGRSRTGYAVQGEADLMGMAKVMRDIETAGKERAAYIKTRPSNGASGIVGAKGN